MGASTHPARALHAAPQGSRLEPASDGSTSLQARRVAVSTRLSDIPLGQIPPSGIAASSRVKLRSRLVSMRLNLRGDRVSRVFCGKDILKMRSPVQIKLPGPVRPQRPFGRHGVQASFLLDLLKCLLGPCGMPRQAVSRRCKPHGCDRIIKQACYCAPALCCAAQLLVEHLKIIEEATSRRVVYEMTTSRSVSI
jgi:hypothetical protein